MIVMYCPHYALLYDKDEPEVFGQPNYESVFLDRNNTEFTYLSSSSNRWLSGLHNL
jgi:hypothetical protein